VTRDTKPSEQNMGGNFYLGFVACFGKPHRVVDLQKCPLSCFLTFKCHSFAL